MRAVRVVATPNTHDGGQRTDLRSVTVNDKHDYGVSSLFRNDDAPIWAGLHKWLQRGTIMKSAETVLRLRCSEPGHRVAVAIERPRGPGR